jgi:hypothetical protein
LTLAEPITPALVICATAHFAAALQTIVRFHVLKELISRLHRIAFVAHFHTVTFFL